MVDGDPGADVWAMDVARYGDWATLAYTNAKVRENYSRRFRIRFPNEELPAARPLRTSPIYERLQGALQSGATQVVILGAGFDTRAYRFEELLKEKKVLRFRRRRAPPQDTASQP